MGPGHIGACLDRFLVQSSFLTLGLVASSKILPIYTSDHKPILLDLFLEANLAPSPSALALYGSIKKDSRRSFPVPGASMSKAPVLCLGRKVANSQESLKKLGQNPHVSNFQEKRSRRSSREPPTKPRRENTNPRAAKSRSQSPKSAPSCMQRGGRILAPEI
jgi:hypothetical protein